MKKEMERGGDLDFTLTIQHEDEGDENRKEQILEKLFLVRSIIYVCVFEDDVRTAGFLF